MMPFCLRNNKVFLLVLSCFILGCSASKQAGPVTRTSAFPRLMERAKKDQRLVVMYSGVDSFVVTSMLIEKARKNFTVHLAKLDSAQRVQVQIPQPAAAKHVQVYMRDSVSYTLDEPHTLPFQKIARIEWPG
jgi:hypothetical protein